MTPNDPTDETQARTVIDRRRLMRAVGGTTLGVAGLTGVASAKNGNAHSNGGNGNGNNGECITDSLEYHFYGCSQVCVNKERVKAIIWDESEGYFDWEWITATSNRNDPAVRDWCDVFCYEIFTEGDAIVGIQIDGTPVPNTNRCAENYPDPVSSND